MNDSFRSLPRSSLEPNHVRLRTAVAGHHSRVDSLPPPATVPLTRVPLVNLEVAGHPPAAVTFRSGFRGCNVADVAVDAIRGAARDTAAWRLHARADERACRDLVARGASNQAKLSVNVICDRWWQPNTNHEISMQA